MHENFLAKASLGIFFLSSGIAMLSLQASGQTPEQVRLAFRHIRDDRIKDNGSDAAEWLYSNREQLKDQLLDELYRTDRQGRDAILFAVFHVKDYQPDQKFINMVVARLGEQDKYVGNSDLGVYAHWQAWKFIDKHYAAFKPSLLANLKKTDDMLTIWATAWMLQRKGDLQGELANFTPEMWKRIGLNLNNDDKSYNASQAVRFYLIVGKASVPALEEVMKLGDKQARSLAAATLDAMNGKRAAYGYLGSELAITQEVFGKGKHEPEWLGDEIGNQLNR